MRTIEYKVSFENMITRLPGLFAYLESDEFGNVSLHKATDSLDGCYGKLVENIKLPQDCGCDLPYFKKEYVTSCFVNKYNPLDIITNYEYDNNIEQEQINDYIDYDTPKIITEDEYNDLSVEEQSYYECYYVDTRNEENYITEEEYEKFSLKGGETYTFRTLISFYYTNKDLLDEENKFKKFIEDGIGKIKVGDITLFEEDETNNKFMELVNFELVPKFVFLSNVRKLYNELVKLHKKCVYYYEKIVEQGKHDKYLCCLCDKFEKMGGVLFMEYLKKLIPVAEEKASLYESYADNTNRMNLEFDIDLISSYQDLGILTPYAPQWIPGKRYYRGEKVMYDGEIYICLEENTGEWIEDYLSIVFDGDKFKKYSDYNSFKNILNEEQQKNYKDSRLVVYDEDGKRPEYITGNENLPLKMDGITDTKLKDLRRFATYFNRDEVAELPQDGYDWLFYYRRGDVLNITTINDELGNIKDLTTKRAADENDHNLAAYGDFISDITYDEENCYIEFEYYLGVHLKPENATPTIKYDDDNNKLYCWDKLVWDEDENVGMKYVERYNYVKGGDLDNLINGEYTYQDVTVTFEDYIDGKYDIALQNEKFEFITYNNSTSYTKTIAHQDVNIISILTDYEIYRNDFSEFEQTDLYREEYLNGISYAPTKDIDVKIERGSTSCFEKCISFSEIKTLEDLENFQNGSFFNTTST